MIRTFGDLYKGKREKKEGVLKWLEKTKNKNKKNKKK